MKREHTLHERPESGGTSADELVKAAAAVRHGFGPALATAIAIAILLVLLAGSMAHLTHARAYEALQRSLEEARVGVEGGVEPAR